MNHQNFLKKKFQKAFINRSFITFSLLSMSTVSPFSLESGCKISALKHIRQTFMQGFFRLFCKTLILKEVGRKDFWNEGKRVLKHTLILIRAHAYVYTWKHVPEPFTLFTFPMEWGIFVWNYGFGEGGEGLEHISSCIYRSHIN